MFFDPPLSFLLNFGFAHKVLVHIIRKTVDHETFEGFPVNANSLADVLSKLFVLRLLFFFGSNAKVSVLLVVGSHEALVT
jgi:hypothetical protein